MKINANLEESELNQKEIAQLAGVSVSTVSRVINDDPRISERTKQTVREILAANPYVTNNNARNLRVSRTNAIGFLISSFNNPYFISIYEGLRDICRKRGYIIIVGITDEDPTLQQEAIDLLLSYKVCGIVGSFVTMSASSKAKLQQMCEFVVALDRRIPGFDSDFVGINDEFGGQQQVLHAASYGHRKIAVIYGRLDSAGQGRLNGYLSAMKALNLPLRQEYMVCGNFDESAAYAAALSLLNLPDPPTAIITHNNLMTVGAFKAVVDMQKSIPDDISLVGFDDFLLADYLSPGITRIRHPAHEMGEIAAKTLLERLDGLYSGPSKTVVLPVKLKICNSCKILTAHPG